MVTRDTPYAKELKRGTLRLQDDSEARIERLFVKSEGQEEIRLSWWKDGKMVVRPLDLPEQDLISLIAIGVSTGVFSPDGIVKLRSILSKAKIETMMDEAIDSGEATDWTKQDLESVKAEIQARHAKRQGSPQ